MSEAKKVLLVDDEADFTALFAANLESAGSFEVRQVNDPTEALAVAKEFLPDICIVDIVMPCMDGGDVVAALRGVPELSQTPVLMLTALVEEDPDSPIGESVSGGLPFVSKTSDFDTILSAIEAHLLVAEED